MDKLQLAHRDVVGLCALGVVAIAYFYARGSLPNNEPITTFVPLNVRWEPWHLVFLLGLLGIAYRAASRPPASSTMLHLSRWWSQASRGRTLLVLAAGVVAVAWTGALTVHHNCPMTPDEYAAWFQARIFTTGRIAAVVPAEWRDFADAIAPMFVRYDPQTGTWASQYLPVHAAMLTPFVAIGQPALLNPLLAGLSVLLIAAVSRRLWPEWRAAAPLAATLLAVSPQFLVNSMSFYAMPAHLCLNLLWLYLWLRDDRRGDALALLVGAAALGLHQFVPHALFVAPFFLYMAWRGSYSRLAWYLPMYIAALAFWWSWLQKLVPHVQGNISAAFGWPFGREAPLFLSLHTMNLLLLVSWQSIAVTVPAAYAVRAGALRGPMVPIAAGLILTFAFYLFFLFDQAVGWGYRYTYPVLGNLTLLGVAGWRALRPELPLGRRAAFLAVGLLGAVLFQLPYRLVQTERNVRPFARTLSHIKSFPEPVVVVDDQGWIWARNDPLFQYGPIIVSGRKLRDDYRRPMKDHLDALQALAPLRVIQADEVSPSSLR